MLRLVPLLAVVVLLACARPAPRRWLATEPDARGDAKPPPCLGARGSLDEKESLETLATRSDEIDACLSATGEAPELELSVAGDGAVTSVRHVGTDGPASVAVACVENALRSLKFAPPSCDLPAMLAFRFRAGSVPEAIETEDVCTGGGLSKAAIGDVIKSNWSQVKFCYERRLREQDLEGKLTAMFLIDANGDVRWVSLLTDTLGDPEVGRCTVGALRGWKFPKPRCGGTVIVTYPCVFRMAR